MNINTKLITDNMNNSNLTKTEFCKLCEIGQSTLHKLLTNNHSIGTSTAQNYKRNKNSNRLAYTQGILNSFIGVDKVR